MNNFSVWPNVSTALFRPRIFGTKTQCRNVSTVAVKEEDRFFPVQNMGE